MEDYLSKDLHDHVFDQTKQASQLANEIASKAKNTFVSPAHNIPIRSEYVPVKVPICAFPTYSTSSPPSTPLSAEHFCHYGDGHRLTYYRGNDNTPQLGLPDDFLDRLLVSTSIIEAEVKESRERLGRSTTQPYKWRLTLNDYRTASNNDGEDVVPRTNRVGFPWHRDLEANGASTMILGLGSPERLEFGTELNFDLAKPPPKDNQVKHPEKVKTACSIILKPGSLLVLTGPARWHYVHRVLNCTTDGGDRASLVYGVW